MEPITQIDEIATSSSGFRRGDGRPSISTNKSISSLPLIAAAVGIKLMEERPDAPYQLMWDESSNEMVIQDDLKQIGGCLLKFKITKSAIGKTLLHRVNIINYLVH